MLLLIALGGTFFVHFRFRVPLGFSLMIFFVGWPIGGTLVTIDDDLKGAGSNPDGTVRLLWLQTPFWVKSRADWRCHLADSLSTLVGVFGRHPILVRRRSGGLPSGSLDDSRRWWLLFGMSFGFGAMWTAG